MTEQKHWTLDEINSLVNKDKREYLSVYPVTKHVEIRRYAVDLSGNFIVRAFEHVNDHYEEIDLPSLLEELSEKLAKAIHPRALLKNAFQEMGIFELLEAKQKLAEEPKAEITTGVQKGSCYYIYIGGALQKKSVALRLTR